MSSGKSLALGSSPATSAPDARIQAEVDAIELPGEDGNLNEEEDEEEQQYNGANEKYEPSQIH